MQTTMPLTACRASVFANTPSAQSRSSRRQGIKTQALFGFGKKKEDPEKEEQFRLQQEVLARRRKGSWQKEVAERRADVSRYMNDKDYKKKLDDIKFEKYMAEKKAQGDPKFGIIIPVNPMGIPLFDGGLRFDLRGKYVDEGWVDPDADVMGKLGRFFSGKKQEAPAGEKVDAKKKGKK